MLNIEIEYYDNIKRIANNLININNALRGIETQLQKQTDILQKTYFHTQRIQRQQSVKIVDEDANYELVPKGDTPNTYEMVPKKTKKQKDSVKMNGEPPDKPQME